MFFRRDNIIITFTKHLEDGKVVPSRVSSSKVKCFLIIFLD